MLMGVTQEICSLPDGGRLALFGGNCVPPVNSIVLDEILERRAVLMDIILGVIAVISLCCSCFAVGYTLGKDINKTQK